MGQGRAYLSVLAVSLLVSGTGLRSSEAIAGPPPEQFPPRLVALTTSHDLLATDSNAIVRFLETARPAAVSAEDKARVLSTLPLEGEVTNLNGAARRKLATLAEVLRAIARDSVYEVKVIDVPQAAIALHGRAVILISEAALTLLDADELQALLAHEVGHEYVWTERERSFRLADRSRLNGTLMAQPFDLSTLSVRGSPMPLAEDLLYFRNLGQADFSVSTNGVLVYQAGNTQSRLVWFRRNGSEGTQVGEPGDYGFTALSPDETLVATDVMDRRAGTTDIQVFDLVRGGKPSNVTLDPTIDWTPVFSPDRQQLAFASARGGPPHVHVKRLNDSSPAQQLVGPSAAVQFVTDWYDGAGGSFIVFQEVAPGTGLDLVQVARSGDLKPVPLVRTAGHDTDGRVSPNGRWLAYVSTETGRNEVYVRALTGGNDRWPISTDGGVSPRWRRDGRELFYIATASTLPFGATVPDGRLMAVEVSGAVERFTAGIPKLLFPVSAKGSQYHPTRDGQRFLINTGSGASALSITVTVNWPSALTR